MIRNLEKLIKIKYSPLRFYQLLNETKLEINLRLSKLYHYINVGSFATHLCLACLSILA